LPHIKFYLSGEKTPEKERKMRFWAEDDDANEFFNLVNAGMGLDANGNPFDCFEGDDYFDDDE
jgi:hypothetical protein